METVGNRITRSPARERRILFCAYCDSEHCKAEASDNVFGASAMLFPAERLRDLHIELLLFSGEDR